MEEWNGTTGNEENPYDTFLQGSRFWIQRVLLPLVLVVGVIGNGITIIVLTRPKMRSSTNTYLTALAIADLLYLFFAFTNSLEHYPGIHGPDFYYYWQYRRVGLWLTDATSYISILLTVTFTIERYIAVCHPMRGKLLCTESRAKIAIVIIYLVCLVATMTTPLEWKVQVSVSGNGVDGNRTQQYINLTNSELGVDETYRTVFYWFSTVTFTFLPLVLLSIFNTFLVCAVHRSRKTRCKMTQTDSTTSTQKQENKITVTLIAVVLLFMVCQTPSAVLLIFQTCHKTIHNGSNQDKLHRGLGNIFNFLVTVNAAANFILYCALSAKYRRTLLRTFFGRRYKRRITYPSSVATLNFSHFGRSSFKSAQREKSSFDAGNSNRRCSPRQRNGTLGSLTLQPEEESIKD